MNHLGVPDEIFWYKMSSSVWQWIWLGFRIIYKCQINTATIVIFIAKLKYLADRTLIHLLLFKILLMSITLEVKVDVPLNKKVNKLLKSCNDSNSNQVEILLKINLSSTSPTSVLKIYAVFALAFWKVKKEKSWKNLQTSLLN